MLGELVNIHKNPELLADKNILKKNVFKRTINMSFRKTIIMIVAIDASISNLRSSFVLTHVYSFNSIKSMKTILSEVCGERNVIKTAYE